LRADDRLLAERILILSANIKKSGRTDRRRRELQRLQLAIAKQQAEREEQARADHRRGGSIYEVRPVVGMPADVVLTLPGYSRHDRLRSPVVVGWDRFGLKVRWYYHDLTLLLKRIEAGGLYQVAEVEEVEERGSDAEA
jgi:hypothetical protein